MSTAQHTLQIGCPECAWGKVAGCWRCGSRVAQHTPGPWTLLPWDLSFMVRREWSNGRFETLNRPGTNEPRVFRSEEAARTAIAKATGSAA